MAMLPKPRANAPTALKANTVRLTEMTATPTLVPMEGTALMLVQATAVTVHSCLEVHLALNSLQDVVVTRVPMVGRALRSRMASNVLALLNTQGQPVPIL